MARRGGIIENRVTGERITWLETASDSAGERLAFLFEVKPSGRLPVVHVHPAQAETFVVESGEFEITLGAKGGEIRRLVARLKRAVDAVL